MVVATTIRRRSSYHATHTNDHNRPQISPLLHRPNDHTPYYYERVTSPSSVDEQEQKQEEEEQKGHLRRSSAISWMGTRLSLIDLGRLRTQVQIAAHPTTLADFLLVDMIGKGSFGKVYEVRHRRSGTNFAMKVLSKRRLVRKSMVVEKVLSEMTILEQLDHPFIATLWFTFGDDTHIYMLSEFLAGGDLRRHLNQRGRFSESRAKLYLCELALALEYLRLKAIAHLDVKPENILLDVEGHTRLCDFNLAVRLKDADERICSFTGTRTYMAPEVLKTSLGVLRGYDTSADWWSLGVCFYELLRGRPPFEFTPTFSTQQVLALHQTRSFILPAQWPSDLTSFITRLLDPEPETRITSLAKFTSHCYLSRMNMEKVYERRTAPPRVRNHYHHQHHFHCHHMSERDSNIPQPSPLQKRMQRGRLKQQTSDVSSCLSNQGGVGNQYVESMSHLNEKFKPYNRLQHHSEDDHCQKLTFGKLQATRRSPLKQASSVEER